MGGLHLVDLLIGFIAGGLVCAGIPAAAKWFSKQETSLDARVKVLEAWVKAKT